MPTGSLIPRPRGGAVGTVTRRPVRARRRASAWRGGRSRAGRGASGQPARATRGGRRRSRASAAGACASRSAGAAADRALPGQRRAWRGSVLVGGRRGTVRPRGGGPQAGAAWATDRPPAATPRSRWPGAWPRCCSRPPSCLLARRGPARVAHPVAAATSSSGVRELLARGMTLLLADDMGLGKTVQALAALRMLAHPAPRRLGAGRRAGGAAPPVARRGAAAGRPELRLSTVHGGAADRRWQWRAPAHVYLTSYETLRADFTDNPHSPRGAPVGPGDPRRGAEDQERRRPTSAASASACGGARQWALTGTPLENSPDDLVSLLEFVHPDAVARAPPGPADRPRCARSWAACSCDGARPTCWRTCPRSSSAASCCRSPRPSARATSGPSGRASSSCAPAARACEVQHVLALIVRLKQICNFCPATGASSKLDDLRERVGDAGRGGLQGAGVHPIHERGVRGARRSPPAWGARRWRIPVTCRPRARDHVLHQFRTRPERHACWCSRCWRVARG